jgi:protein-S-isoprenylcysteine O-methyltransferase Ste14
MLFGLMRGIATVDAAREGDWLASAHHGIVGVAMLIMSVLPIVRRPAVKRSDGLMPKAIAAIGGYAIIPLGALPLTWRPDWLLATTTVGIVAMTALEIWALLTLRRSFSVFPEARKLVTHGPYGYVRHPLYTVYIVTYSLIALPRFGVLAVFIAGLAILAQVLRSRSEEAVLRSAFTEYDEYSAKVPAFVPWLRQRLAAVPTTAHTTEPLQSDRRRQSI